MAVHARVDPFGFLESPYRRIVDGKVTGEIDWLPADNEHYYRIAPASARLKDDGSFEERTLQVRHNNEYPIVPTGQIDYMDVSPQQLVSVATAMIPFLENDDANRALMGANMQRQAVPTLRPSARSSRPASRSGPALDSGAIVVAKRGGRVRRVTARRSWSRPVTAASTTTRC
jgi:DNA-directed RNA polymerase subunit beta